MADEKGWVLVAGEWVWMGEGAPPPLTVGHAGIVSGIGWLPDKFVVTGEDRPPVGPHTVPTSFTPQWTPPTQSQAVKYLTGTDWSAAGPEPTPWKMALDAGKEGMRFRLSVDGNLLLYAPELGELVTRAACQVGSQHLRDLDPGRMVFEKPMWAEAVYNLAREMMAKEEDKVKAKERGRDAMRLFGNEIHWDLGFRTPDGKKGEDLVNVACVVADVALPEFGRGWARFPTIDAATGVAEQIKQVCAAFQGVREVLRKRGLLREENEEPFTISAQEPHLKAALDDYQYQPPLAEAAIQEAQMDRMDVLRGGWIVATVTMPPRAKMALLNRLALQVEVWRQELLHQIAQGE